MVDIIEEWTYSMLSACISNNSKYITPFCCVTNDLLKALIPYFPYMSVHVNLITM